MTGQLINFASLAKDAGVSPPTIAGYYEILKDTFVGFSLSPWRKPTSRKSISTSKFYIFDTGVANALAGTQAIDRNSNLYGALFEQWIALELRAYLSYRRSKRQLFFWRTEDQLEVDFIVGDTFALEVKASKRVTTAVLKALKVLKAEGLVRAYYIVSNDPIDRLHEGIHIQHWRTFMTNLWADQVMPLEKPNGWSTLRTYP